MPIPRVLADIVALPDRTYLIVNGAKWGIAGFGSSSGPVWTALLYNPAKPLGARFSILASTTISRLYHSEAILAMDGRVIIAGSTPNQDSNTPANMTIHPDEKRIEAYNPPYLSNGATRPNINSVSSTNWNYNTAYTIVSTIPTGNAANLHISLIQVGAGKLFLLI